MDLVVQSPDSSKRKDSLPRVQCSRISLFQKLSEQSTSTSQTLPGLSCIQWSISRRERAHFLIPLKEYLFTTPQLLLWGWLRILLGLDYCSASPFAQSYFHPLLHRCWLQEYFLVNILHSDLCLRVCFLEDRATSLPHPINHKVLLISLLNDSACINSLLCYYNFA